MVGPAREDLPPEERVIGICGCGRPLNAKFDADGKRTGVTHFDQDDTNWHDEFFAGLRVELPQVPPEDGKGE